MVVSGKCVEYWDRSELKKINPALKQEAIKLLERRGPDHTGQIQVGEKVWFVHARLSIIDLFN